jgi:hypothetical protein
MGDQLDARLLPTQNKRTQTSMLQVRFEHTIPVFERVKSVHTLDRAATVIGMIRPRKMKFVGNIARIGEKENYILSVGTWSQMGE